MLFYFNSIIISVCIWICCCYFIICIIYYITCNTISNCNIKDSNIYGVGSNTAGGIGFISSYSALNILNCSVENTDITENYNSENTYDSYPTLGGIVGGIGDGKVLIDSCKVIGSKDKYANIIGDARNTGGIVGGGIFNSSSWNTASLVLENNTVEYVNIE